MTSRNQSKSSRGNRSNRSSSNGAPRGFAAMDPERRREIASRGGRASHGGHEERGPQNYQRQSSGQDNRQDHRGGQQRQSHQEHGRQGFASMDPEKRREIASLGGRASHQGDQHRGSGGHRAQGQRQSHQGQGRQGFASMEPEKRREIASRGGRASHQGQGWQDSGPRDQEEQRRFSNEGHGPYEREFENYNENRAGGQYFEDLDEDDQGYSTQGHNQDYDREYNEENYNEKNYNDSRNSRWNQGNQYWDTDQYQ